MFKDIKVLTGHWNEIILQESLKDEGTNDTPASLD